MYVKIYQQCHPIIHILLHYYNNICLEICQQVGAYHPIIHILSDHNNLHIKVYQQVSVCE